jgi:predicted ATPase
MNEPNDGRADLYSFGVVLYEMLTGEKPFVGEEPIAIIFQHINDEAPLPSAHLPDLPMEVDRLVMTLMAKQTSDRYPSAKALLADLAICRDLVKDGGISLQDRMVYTEAPRRPRDEFFCTLSGRETELDRIRTAIDQALEGDGQLILLAGSEGTGKSRLILEMLSHAEERTMWTLVGRCMYQEMAMPYQSFIDALGRRFSTVSSVGQVRFRKHLLEDYPEIAALMPHAWSAQERSQLEKSEPITLTPIAEQQRLFQAILHLLFEMADERGIVLCMDDLHWGDTGSVQLLHYLARQLQGHRICLVAAYRPEEVQETSEAPFGETLRRLQAEGLGKLVTLDNLDEPAIRQMVQEITGSRAVSVSVSDRVYNESGGNPLFAIEILKWWRDRSKTHVLDQGTLDTLEGGGEIIPPRITDLIARRLNRLHDNERELLEVAAVGGVRFDASDLATTLEMDHMGVLRHLNRLERSHGLILPVEGPVYQFTHGKIQDVLYQELPEVLRQEYHAAWGRMLLVRKEAGADIPIERLANHLYLGGDEDAALPYLMQAGERAQKMYAFREARQYWEQADAVLSDEADERVEEKIQVLLELARMYYELGQWDTATDYNKKAFELGEKARDLSARARALIQLGAILVGQNKWEAAVKLFEEGIKMHTQAGNNNGIAVGYNYLGQIAHSRGQWDLAKTHFQRSLDIVSEINDVGRMAHASNNLGLISFAEGDNNSATAYYETSNKQHKDSNNIPGIATVDSNLGMVYERLEKWDEATNYHRESVELIERMGNTRQLWNAYINLARVSARTNDLVLAEEIIEKAKDILKDLKNQRGLAEAKRVDGLIAYLKEEWDQAQAFFVESEHLCTASKDPYGHAETIRERAYMFMKKGDRDRAIEILQQAERAFHDIGANGDVAVIRRKLEELATPGSHDDASH